MISCGLALSCLSVALAVLVSYITHDGFPKDKQLLYLMHNIKKILLLFNTSVHVGINIRQANK